MMKMKELWSASEEKEKAQAEKMGVQFVYPNKAPFQQAVQPMYQQLQAKDPELSQMVDGMAKL
ncbi:hypothetical protein D3C79_1055060 [compost metagenome]